MSPMDIGDINYGKAKSKAKVFLEESIFILSKLSLFLAIARFGEPPRTGSVILKGTGIVLALWTSTKVEKYLCGYNLSTYVDEEEQEISLKSYNYDIRYGRSIRLINTK